MPRLRSLHAITRHGDRTPSYNVFRGHAGERAEAELWRRKAVPQSETRRLQERFPIQSRHADVPHDRRAFPFGVLTGKGLAQVRWRGRAVAAIADALGGLARDARNASALSTNFMRTQYSAQGFLDGFLGPEAEAAGLLLPVEVRPREEEIINGFERWKQAWELCAQEADAPEFVAREQCAAHMRERFLRQLPVPPDKFRWIMAVDHAVCRAAHGVPDVDGLQAYGEQCQAHLLWRFRRYFANPRIQRLSAVPMLEAILESADDARHGAGPEFTLFSGHDVSILSVLATLGAPDPQWPPYASALVLAVIEKRSGATVVRLIENGEPVLDELPIEGLRDLVQTLAAESSVCD